MMDELAYCDTHSDGLAMVRYQYGLHRLFLLRRICLMMPFISADYVLAAELALFGRIVAVDDALSRFTLGGGTGRNFVAWDPVAIQRMLAPTRVGRLDMQWSVRRRHFEKQVARCSCAHPFRRGGCSSRSRPRRDRRRAGACSPGSPAGSERITVVRDGSVGVELLSVGQVRR